KPASLRPVFGLPCQTANLWRIKILAQWCRSRHDEPPGFAMLNLTRLHLGIAHESQFQGLGITFMPIYVLFHFVVFATNQSIPVYAIVTGGLGAFVALVTVIQGPAGDSIFLKAVDILTSVGGILCVGIGLVRLANGQTPTIAGWIAACFYCLRAAAEFPFWFSCVNPASHSSISIRLRFLALSLP